MQNILKHYRGKGKGEHNTINKFQIHNVDVAGPKFI